MYKKILLTPFLVLATGCQSINKVEIGDNAMSCEQLRTEISIKDNSRKADVNKTMVGAGVAAAGMASPIVAFGAVVAAPILIPVAIIGGAAYGSSKAYNAYQNKERIEHLTDLYNKKGCASSTYASSPAAPIASATSPDVKIIIRDEELIKVQKSLSERGYEPGVIDGIYGNKTKLALELFQEENGLAITGKADIATKALLLKYD